MGKVIRVTLRFRTRFWETIRPDKHSGNTLARMNYLFTQDDWFPTWWTRMRDELPLITGWAPAGGGERLSGKSRSYVVEQALRSLVSFTIGRMIHFHAVRTATDRLDRTARSEIWRVLSKTHFSLLEKLPTPLAITVRYTVQSQADIA
jgi:hypothetical protein